MAITIIRQTHYRNMPWKNGGGTTAEILLGDVHGVFGEPSKQPYQWRVSLASIGSSGPFSLFPDFDRYLIPISGDAMELVFSDDQKKVICPGEVMRFRGDDAITCNIIAATTDLNLMIDRRVILAKVDVLKVVANQPIDLGGRYKNANESGFNEEFKGGLPADSIGLIAFGFQDQGVNDDRNIKIETSDESWNMMRGETLWVDARHLGESITLRTPHDLNVVVMALYKI